MNCVECGKSLTHELDQFGPADAPLCLVCFLAPSVVVGYDPHEELKHAENELEMERKEGDPDLIRLAEQKTEQFREEISRDKMIERRKIAAWQNGLPKLIDQWDRKMAHKMKVHKDDRGIYLAHGNDKARPLVNAGSSELAGAVNTYRSHIERLMGRRIAWNNQSSFVAGDTVLAQHHGGTIYYTVKGLDGSDPERWFIHGESSDRMTTEQLMNGGKA